MTSYKSNLYSLYGPARIPRAVVAGKVSLITIIVEKNDPMLMISLDKKLAILEVL